MYGDELKSCGCDRASMGIGEAIAKVFADEGAGVVLLSRDVSRGEAGASAWAMRTGPWRSRM